jgi:hypothetical protein
MAIGLRAATTSANATLNLASTKKASPVVEGYVKFKGKPVYHADVILMIEPPPPLLHKESKLPKCPKHPKHPCTGRPLKLKPLGKVYTNKKGYFAISVTGKALQTAESYSFSFGKKRVVNLMVSADWLITRGISKGTIAGSEHWFVRLYLPVGLKTDAAADGTVMASLAAVQGNPDAPDVVNMNLSTGYIPKRLEGVFKADEQQLAAASGTTLQPSFAIPPYWCGLEMASPNGYQLGTWDIPDPNVLTDIGQTYSNMSHVTMNFTYNAGQNSSLGVAVSVPGGSGPLGWFLGANAGYQVTITSNIGIPYDSSSGFVNTIYETGFIYQIYFTRCPPYYTAAPSGFGGGSHQIQVTSPGEYNQHCAWYEANASRPVTMGTSKAVTFSAGVDLSKFIGIKLSAQTGYDHDAEASYLLPKGGWLCGSDANPGNPSPGFIYAGKYNGSHHGNTTTR